MQTRKLYADVSEVGWNLRYVWNNELVELDLVQHQISFAGSSDVRLSFASHNITCPSKTNLMLDSGSSNKCLTLCIRGVPIVPFCSFTF